MSVLMVVIVEVCGGCVVMDVEGEGECVSCDDSMIFMVSMKVSDDDG